MVQLALPQKKGPFHTQQKSAHPRKRATACHSQQTPNFKESSRNGIAPGWWNSRLGVTRSRPDPSPWNWWPRGENRCRWLESSYRVHLESCEMVLMSCISMQIKQYIYIYYRFQVPFRAGKWKRRNWKYRFKALRDVFLKMRLIPKCPIDHDANLRAQPRAIPKRPHRGAQRLGGWCQIQGCWNPLHITSQISWIS